MSAMDHGSNLDTVYNPQAVEKAVYQSWEAAGAFRAQPDDTPHDKTFTIVIPPPNVTGALHLGHALNNTLQDILIRYYRMRGFNTLWQPGCDHAGIATQAVVERRIRETEGKNRHDIGREELVKRIWKWKDEYEDRIIGQLKEMGCSCDWERTRFTLDEGLVRAVRHQFFHLFKDGLIFRGKRLVNWDTDLQTAVANDEVYHETVEGHFWHFRYPVIDPKPGEPEHVVIATTRPETMLGDTAVAVHPDPEAFFAKQETTLRTSLVGASEKESPEIEAKLETLETRRKSHLAGLVKLRDMAVDGRRLRLPLMEREIPLITDDWADPSKGSGCVKITPAHDSNDYEVGVRNDLPMINVLTVDGKIARIVEADGSVNPHSGDYEGLIFSGAGREKVVAEFEARGLIESIEDHKHEVGHSDRSKTPIEPFLSDQWFVRTGEEATKVRATEKGARTSDEATKGIRLGDGSYAPGLAQAAIDVVDSGKIKIFPERYAKSYVDWLGEKRDWCISRQLWWGHRIPVWRFEPHADTLSALLSGQRTIPER
ncbi:MAG: class I tRNA ligase family protein, partial [Planctomycetes bacterium]|nr:class I tRNA ligase family protein [Planctomycetota bacterium]